MISSVFSMDNSSSILLTTISFQVLYIVEECMCPTTKIQCTSRTSSCEGFLNKTQSLANFMVICCNVEVGRVNA